MGIRTRIAENSIVDHAVIMGADFFESKDELLENSEKGIPNVGIGRDCEIRYAIIDKNARIGNGVKLINSRGVQEESSENYVIRDGIIVIPKRATIPDRTVI